MPAILTIDLERSWLDSLAVGLDPTASETGSGTGIAIDEPGKLFRVRGLDRWMEPRFTSYGPAREALRGEPIDVVFTIRIFVKVEAKGERQLVLSEVVDEVRRLIDPLRGARPLSITDVDGRTVGLLEYDPPTETRAYNQTETIRGDSIPGLDSATLSVGGRLTGVVC